jgi:5-methylthioadenosine/S-adenosylhomocysteine deaminase
MSRIQADILVRARWVLPMIERGRVLEQHAVAIRNGRIVAILPSAEAEERIDCAQSIDRAHHVLLPALVNAHGHAAMTLLRGVAEGLPLDPWLRRAIWPLERKFVGPDFVRDGTRLAIAEMLRAGTGTFADMYLFPDAAAQAAVDAGMRAVVGLPIVEAPSAWAQDAAGYFEKALQVADAYKGHPLIRTVFAPHAPHGVSDETLVHLRTLADELDAGIVMHLHESRLEIERSKQRHGCRPLARLERLGLLNPALNAVHMVELDEADLEMACRGGIGITLCPESNLKLGNGVAQYARLAACGLRLGVGTDGAASNNDLDLWSEMKLAALLSCAQSGSAPAMGAWDALALGTSGAAAVLGLEEVGTLAVGHWADLTCVDLSSPATQPLYDVPAQLVFAGGRDCVTDVWVAGRQLLAQRELTRLDWGSVCERAGRWSRQIAAEVAP